MAGPVGELPGRGQRGEPTADRRQVVEWERRETRREPEDGQEVVRDGRSLARESRRLGELLANEADDDL